LTKYIDLCLPFGHASLSPCSSRGDGCVNHRFFKASNLMRAYLLVAIDWQRGFASRPKNLLLSRRIHRHSASKPFALTHGQTKLSINLRALFNGVSLLLNRRFTGHAGGAQSRKIRIPTGD